METNLRYFAAVKDIAEYSAEVLEVVKDMKYQDYLSDRRTRLMVERCLSIIGEACVRIRKLEIEHNLPDLEKIIQFRNILIHAYDGIDPNTVWLIVQSNLPALLMVAESIVRANMDLGENQIT